MGCSSTCHSMQERLQMVLIFIGFTLAALVIYCTWFAWSIISMFGWFNSKSVFYCVLFAEKSCSCKSSNPAQIRKTR